MATGSSTQQFAIRRATLEDLPRLCVLLEHYYDEWNVVQRDPPKSVSEYISAPEPCGFLVAEHEHLLAACVQIRKLDSHESALECKRLYVVRQFRGHRLASRLMDSVEDRASRTADWLYLDTGSEFTAAQALYRTRGYEACDRYNDNLQAVFFYRKRLRN